MNQIKLVIVMILWGGTFVSGKILAQELSPQYISFYRFLIASICLFFIFYKKIMTSLKNIRLPDIIGCCGLGVFGVFSYNILFFKGLESVEASKASIIIALNPVLTFFLSHILLGEKVNKVRSLGCLLSFLGAIIVITQLDLDTPFLSQFSIGELSLLAASICWSLYTILGRKVLLRLNPETTNTLAIIFGTILLFLFSQEDIYETPSFHQSLHLIFFGLLATSLGFVWYYEGVKQLGAQKASIFINLVPVFGTIFGVIFLKEVLHYSLIIGSIFILIGIYFINRR